MGLTQVKAAGIAADSIDESKIADNGIDSEHYNDGSIDHEHLANDAVDGDIIADNAVGLAHMAHGTDGNLITYNASGEPAHVATGNDGQVLTSQGAGQPPQFETISTTDTKSFRNVLVNGAMRVNQKETSKSSVTSSGYHVIDTYRFVDSSIGTWTVSQDSESPTQFSKSYKMACTTANASPASSSAMRLECRLEGNQLQGFHKGTSDAKPLALSFWTKTNEPGVYTVSLYDNNNNRNVAANYTVSSGEASAQTWVKREVVFPADTTGAWNDDNAKSATLTFYFDVGSGWKSGTQNTSWGAASDAVTCPGMTAALGDNTSNVFYLTGIQLEPTSVTDFEYRSYADELQRCKRYYQKLDTADGNNSLHAAWGIMSTAWYGYFQFSLPVEMRNSGSCSLEGTWAILQGNDWSGDVDFVSYDSPHSFHPAVRLGDNGNNFADGNHGFAIFQAQNDSSARINFYAEL